VDQYAASLAERETADGGSEQKIHVDEIASKVAGFYEKVRNVIEYRDAHLLRKGAILRILRRRVLFKDFSDDFAEPLIKELIRSGHLANDTVPETKIADVRGIIANLLFFLKAEKSFSVSGIRSVSSEWLVGMFASRIEEELFPFPEGVLLAEMMYGTMKEGLVLRNCPLEEREAGLQLFIAVQKALFRPDPSQLEYILLKVTYPSWGNFSDAELAEVAGNLAAFRMTAKKILENPFAPYFLKVCNKEKIIFQLIGDLVFDRAPLDDFESQLKFLYGKRYQKAAQQLHRLAFFSVLSFLISKMVVAIAIEVPLDQYLYHAVSLTSMAVNIIFPPFLMLLIVLGVRLPSKQNYDLVERAVREIIGGDEKRKYTVVIPKKKGGITRFFVYLAYAAALVAVLYYATKELLALHFSPASIVIFLLFTSMVVATGVKIRNRTKEMSLEKEKASVWSFLADLVIVPFMTIGRWIISGLSKFNVLVIIFNFLIELPFQFFIEFIENFREFVKARKEEID